ncbi:MAG: phosphatase PAP2 family protein [Candidatus Shapirobacteria bacterium]|jgi:membrane-associated phospholipid phosphatase
MSKTYSFLAAKIPLFFWQPRFDFLKYLESFKIGRIVLITLNYSIWILMIFVSFRLVSLNQNIFWQLFVASVAAEIVEKYGKSHKLWLRPMFQRHDTTPVGLVDSWYKTGSFPSGHTTKATFFLLFIIQYGVFSPTTFYLIATPLLVFRVLVGFHYPVDIFAGLILGWLIWLFSNGIIFPSFVVWPVSLVFSILK